MFLTVIFYWDSIFNFAPLRHLIFLLLTMPVIYDLIKTLFGKNEPNPNKGIKIYALVLVSFYMLDWLAYMIETQLNDDPSDYFGYAMGYFSLLLLAPIMFSFAKDIFEHSKAPRNIFFITCEEIIKTNYFLFRFYQFLN